MITRAGADPGTPNKNRLVISSMTCLNHGAINKPMIMTHVIVCAAAPYEPPWLVC